MAVKIEGVPVCKAKMLLDSKPWISLPELPYFLLPVRPRSNCRSDRWVRKLFQMIRSLDAQRMPRAICLWQITSEVFQKNNFGSAADPVKLDLIGTKLLWRVGLYWADVLRNGDNYNKRNKTIIFCAEEYSVICGRMQGTVLRCRYERSDMLLKLAECQEQISVLQSMTILITLLSRQTMHNIYIH